MAGKYKVTYASKDKGSGGTTLTIELKNGTNEEIHIEICGEEVSVWADTIIAGLPEHTVKSNMTITR